MQQMKWREELEEAASEDDLNRLGDELNVARNAEMQAMAALLDGSGGIEAYHQAAQHVRALMFMEKFGHELEARYDALQA